jgi:flagellar motor protein MotB
MRHGRAHIEEESFFVSMTDIMVGLLFIFIMIIMYFALQAKIDEQKIITQEVTIGLLRKGQSNGAEFEKLTSYQRQVAQQRMLLLGWIKLELEQDGILGVEVIEDQGILRLPEGILFDSNQFNVSEGTNAYNTASSLSNALATVLPCSVLNADGEPLIPVLICELSLHHNINGAFIKGIYIEGHTDNDPVPDTGLLADPRIDSNLKLAARRSTNTLERLQNENPQLVDYFGPSYIGNSLVFEPILASSAYGELRPSVENSDETNKKINRRIDLKVEMYQPINIESLEALNARIFPNLVDEEV